MGMRSLGLENLDDLGDDPVEEERSPAPDEAAAPDDGEVTQLRPRPTPQPVARPRPAPVPAARQQGAAGGGRPNPAPPAARPTQRPERSQTSSSRAGAKNNQLGVGVTPTLNTALKERWASAREDINSLLSQALVDPVTPDEASLVSEARRQRGGDGVIPRRINPTDEDLTRLEEAQATFPFLSRSALVCLLLNRLLGLPLDA